MSLSLPPGPVPEYYPEKIFKGDTATWLVESVRAPDPTTGKIVNYSPTTQTLNYSFRGAGQVDAAAVDESGHYRVTLSPATTSLLEVGNWLVQVFATNAAGDRRTIATGSIQVVDDLAAISTPLPETRSILQQQIDAVNNAILAVLNGKGVQEYSIHGRSLRRYSLSELYTLRAQLMTEFNRNKGRSDRRLLRFVDPTCQ